MSHPLPVLVPWPLAVDPVPGDPFVITEGTAILAAGDSVAAATFLGSILRRATGFDIPVRPPGLTAVPSIVLRVDPDADVPTGPDPGHTAEAYVLSARSDGVLLVGRTGHAVFNAVQTLRQLLPAWIESPIPTDTAWEIPAIRVADRPRFRYRAIMLDVARSFLSVAEVKLVVDTLVGLKLNALHLHLADDQGWRIEISNEDRHPDDPIDYRALTRRSGPTAITQSGYRGETGRAGWYTQQDYAEIVSYCAERYVTVVPEVDLPGHSNAALHALTALNTARSMPAADPSTGVTATNGTDAVGYSALDETSEHTYRFVRQVFGQLAALTPGPYLHIGGDESHDMGPERFSVFVRRVIPLVREVTGKQVIGWQEMARVGLGADLTGWHGVVAQYWAGTADWAPDFLDQGGTIIYSHEDGGYLDMKYDPASPIGRTWPAPLPHTAESYRRGDPAVRLGRHDDHGILGVEGPLWSETIRGVDQALYLALPRAAAVLEVGWSPPGAGSGDFIRRLGQLGARYTAARQTFFAADDVPWTPSFTGVLPASIKPPAVGPADHADPADPRVCWVAWVAWVAAPGMSPAEGDPRRLIRSEAVGIVPRPDPLTASVEVDGVEVAVRFAPADSGGPLGPTGLFLACLDDESNRRRDDRAGPAVLHTSTGHRLPIRLVWRELDDLVPPPGGPTGPTTLRLGTNGSVRGGEWEPLALSGFPARTYLRIEVAGRQLGVVRTGPAGAFAGWIPVPRDLPAGRHAVLAIDPTAGAAEAAVAGTVTVSPR